YKDLAERTIRPWIAFDCQSGGSTAAGHAGDHAQISDYAASKRQPWFRLSNIFHNISYARVVLP
ncbi:MAG: hypothetical protein ACREDZ_11485, partial [Kiloniellales bacterium]